ncbi:MAG: ECF transporter S component [Ruminococcaceae bacterium]|nr:ECF transporter S component [Oscillospiraceae bacterium]
MNKTLSRREKLLRMAVVAVFCAMAYACQFVFRIHVSFLTFDAKDAVMAIGAMIFGPIWGVVMALIVSLLEFVSISGTGVYGLIMNFASSASFCAICAGVYRRNRTMTRAIVALAAAVLGTTAIMMVMNLVVTPYYMTGGSVEAVVKILPTLLLPFNLTKTLMNAALVLVLYKPVSVALKKARILKGGPDSFAFDKKTLAVLIGGLALIAICVAIFLIVLHGTI